MLEYGAKQYVKIAAKIGRGLSMDKFVFVENELMHKFMPAKIIEDLKGRVHINSNMSSTGGKCNLEKVLSAQPCSPPRDAPGRILERGSSWWLER